MPFWNSVAIQQDREVAVLGCQVCQLVLLNWPPVFSPPMLAQIHMGPEKAAFWKRVNWPWESPALLQDDEVMLTCSSSPTTSSAWTSHSGLASVVSPEAVYMWGRPWHRVRQTLRFSWKKHRTDFPQVLC